MRKPAAGLILLILFLLPSIAEPEFNGLVPYMDQTGERASEFENAGWQDASSGTGAPRAVNFQGLTTSSGTSVIDATHPGYIGIESPLGWSSEQLEGQLDHLSMWVADVLVNPSLDGYHEEHWFMTANPEYNYDPFYVPDGWTIVKFDASGGTQHPQHGVFELNGRTGEGYDGKIGWRFDANPSSGTAFDPSNQMYISQQIPTGWRSIYSAEITFRYYVSSTSVLDDDVYIFTRVEDYTSKNHVFESSTIMNTWLQATNIVPASAFQSMENLGSMVFDIGLGTDITGQPGSSVHEVYVDEIELRLQVRPFPEQIDLLANGAQVTGSTRGSVSPYVPDGSNRDCYSAIDSNGGSGGVDLNGYSDNGWLDVGADIPTTFGTDWSDAFAYQVGLQFPLHVPQGSAITSAVLQVETPGDSVGFPGMRIYVADEDNVPAFTSGYPLLPDRFDWANTSIYWRPTTWLANNRYNTPDLSSLIQEVVSRPGWQSGNYICVMIDYAYSNQQYAYNSIKGSAGFPQGQLAQLSVDFIAPEPSDTIPSFRFNKRIVIDHTRVVSDLQNFPILVDIWDADLHMNVQPDGDDIAFLYNGQVIPHEIDDFDKLGNGTHAHLSAWVEVPYLSSTQDTTIVMVYGDEDLGNQENPEEIWDSDYSAVWHLSENPAEPQWSSTYADYLPHRPQITDAALPRSDGTSYGSMTSNDLVDGAIGGGIDLEGANDYLDFGNPSELQMSGAFTVEAWFYADYVDNDYLVVKSGESNYRGWDISFDDDPSISPAGWVMFRWSPDGVSTDIVGYERVDTGQWYHVVGVFNPSTFARFYLNGELVGEVTSGIPVSVYNPNRPVRIGRRSDTTEATSYFDGIVDEVRISSIARSDGWIRTQYLNQRNPDLFITVGEERTNFRYKKDITIDHNQVASDLSGFPVLIDIFDTDLRTDVQADGGDIIFVSKGMSLPHEIELFDQQYNATHAHLIAWVKADLSSTSDTVLAMYYGNPSSANQENPLEVWRADYTGVWHLSETAGNARDSTPFDLSGTVSGGIVQSQAGVAGTCYVFNGINGNVNFGNPADGHLDFGENEFTYSLWIRIDDTTDDYQLPVFKGGTTTFDAGYEMETNQAGTDLKAEVSDGATQEISDAISVSFGQWMYIVAVVDRTSGYLRFYMNGTVVGSPTSISSVTDVSNSQNLQLSPFSYPVDGAIDEFRLTSKVRTAEWILTEYNNQRNPSGFYSLGVEQVYEAAGEEPTGFMYKKAITIDQNKVDSNLYGFPVLIDIYDTDLRNDVQPDGGDIIFTKDGWILPHEIEIFDQTYNTSHAHLVAWVRTDLSSSSDTILSMYYGNPEAENQENPTEVWDDSFAAVWHLSEDPVGTVFDSTANSNDGIGLPSGSEPTLETGKIDGCAHLYGTATSDRIEAPHASSLVLQSDMLVEAWVRTSNTDGSSDVIVAKWGDAGHRNYWLGKFNDTALAFFVDNTQFVAAPLSLVNDGEWHHVAGAAKATSGVLLLYVDGIEQASESYSGSTQTGTSVIQIGNNPGSAGYIQEWDGYLDEVRVSSYYRSSSWIKTEYNNQFDPASFFSVGPEESAVPLVFSYKKDITIDHSNIGADLNDFPLLIDIYDSSLRTKVQPDGDDIIFKYGETVLPHEIEVFEQAYNGSHAHLVAWIKADLSSSTDTVITMYYGNPTAGNQEDAESVWESNYKGVWHLSETPGGSFYDSSGNLNHGTGYNLQSDDQVDGQIDGSIDFDSVQDYIECGSDTSLNVGSSDFSLSLWFKYDGVSTGVLAGKGAVLMAKRYRLSIESGPGMLLAAIDDNTVAKNIYSTSTYGDNLWHHVSLVRDGNYLRFYIDGVEDPNSPLDITGYGSLDESESFYINAFRSEVGGTLGYWSSAHTDEVRIANMACSPEWILAEFNNQNDPASFYTVGPETSGESIEFAYAKDIVIDHTKVDVDLTDFPMLIDIYDADLRTDVQSDGDDIIFASGNIILPHEIEVFDQSYNDSHAHLVAWVKTNLSASRDTAISMCYGNSNAPNQENPADVWDSNYTMVHHLNGLSGTHYDSTGNNHDGISSNFDGDEPTSGKIDGAYNFDGINDAINLSMSHPQLYDDFTLSGWYKSTDASLSDDQYIWNHLEGYTETGIVMGVTDDTGEVGHIRLSIYDNSYNFHPYYGTSNIVDQEYHFIVMVRDNGSIKLYVDGNLELDTADLDTGETITVDASTGPFIGDCPGDTEQVKGVLDEIRVSTIGRSINWILTEFNNQNDPANFYSVGDEVALGEPTSFAYKKDITIDHTKVASDLTGFPLLVDIFDSDLKTKAQFDGDDIIFQSGGTTLSHEIELFDPDFNSTHAHLIAWVKIDLSSVADTVVTMYYGNSEASSQEDPAGLWDDNYVGVWHLGETSGGSDAIKDSTSQANHGTDFGSPTFGVEGAIGNAISFDDTPYIQIQDSLSLDSITTGITISAWTKADSYSWETPVIVKGGEDSGAFSLFYYRDTGSNDICYYLDGVTGSTQHTGEAVTRNDWMHVVLTYDGFYVRVYKNGNLASTQLIPSTPSVISNNEPLYFGYESDYDDYFLGVIDEARLSASPRSEEWILTEYNNQYNPDSFYSVGLEEQGGGEVAGDGYTFTTSSDASVTIGAKLSLGVHTSAYSYADDYTLGTSFSIENGSLPIWIANVMVSPPPEIDAVSFKVSYPEGEWWPFSVKSPSGIEMTFGTDWTCFDGELIVGSTAINEYGMWKIQFLDRNHVLDIQMGQAGGPYSQTDEFTIGQDMQYRVQSSGTIGSAISLELTDPSGSVWYSGATTFQGTRFSLPYYHRKQITISHENVAGNLLNFPVLVDIYDSDLRTDVRSDGRDIAFAIGDETLVHEIESFDREFNLTHAHLVAWVKVPLLSGSSDTVISMYYGNPLAPIVYSSGPVWDSGYLGVWHLSESGTGALNEYQDSSQYMHHGQGGEGNTSFVPTQVAGKIGRGQDFNNLDGYYDLIDCGDSPLWNLDGYQITLQAWVQHDITPNTHVYGIMNHKGWYDGYSLFVNYGGGSTLKPTFCLPGETHQLRGANDVTGGTWHHIAATYDGSLMRIYVDGVQDPNVLAKSDAILPSAYEQGFWIGHGDQPKDKVWSAEWEGQIDEVRISDVVRSSSWIQTEFQNQDDPSGFYSIGVEDVAGYSESASIPLDSSASAGVWQATARYSDASTAVDHRAGIISRTFVVKRASTLNLVAPGDAVSDWITSKLIGEELYVEYELLDALTATPIDGATITLNWTAESAPVDVQLNNYGDGSYGKVLNTTDLGEATRWRIEFVASHQFYSNATSVLFLDLSHQTFITYAPPQSTAFGEDFNVRLTLRDAFSNMPITSAGFTSNGTLLGIPVSYGNGTYILTFDSSLLAIGTHAFRITATPTDSYLLSSSIDVQFNYREIYTDAYPVASDPTEIPWGEEASVTVQWNDLDNLGIGIEGGTLSIIQPVTIQTLDVGSGEYFVTIELASYLPGTYVFELVISKTNYQDSTIFVTVVVKVHRTSVSADYEPQTPVGTSTQFNLTFLDIDGGSSGIDSGNLSYVEVDWGSGPQTFSSYSFWLDTSTWLVGVYTINITVYSEAAPRYYLDATISVELVIRKIEVYISWDHLEPFPNGDDFVIVVHLNISEPGTSIDGYPIDGLPQARFSARNDTGSLYALKGFTALGDGAYELVIDEGIFKEGNYIIIVYVDFLSTDDYFDTQTPAITFTYRPILTFLSSENYPTVTTTYDTNVTITLNYVDIDNGANITTGVVTAEGASIQWQHLGNGIYEVIVVVQGWDLGSYEVNITLDAVSYQAKTLTFEVLVQIAYAYARSSISSIDLPVGDIAIFYVDYWDIVHDEPILGASVGHNWIHGLTVTWTGTQYRIELPSYDTDGLASYFIMFNVSKGLNYQIGYFNISLTLRTHYTEYRLASAVEPTTYLGMVNVSLYYGDLDNNAGILSQFVNASVYGESGWIESLLLNDTIRGDGFYIVRFAASVLGESGIYNFTVYFNWTGAIQKFQNGMIRTSVNIIGEESDLSLDDSPGPTPYLENMTYIYYYSELYSGLGITNDTFNVFIRVEFQGASVDLSQVRIWEINSVANPGYYSIQFNSTIFTKPGVYTMIVYVNWSASVSPFYDNQTDTITVRIIPRNTVVAITPPDSTPYGDDATFSFSFDDMVGATPVSIANDTQMIVTINLADYEISYNSTSRRFIVSFNTSILGASLGNKQFTISVTWIGSPFYANVTARTVLISVTARETSLDYATPTPTPYGELVSFIVTYSDVTAEPSRPIEDGIVTLLNGSVPIPVSYYTYAYVGNGQYAIELNSTYYPNPGSYSLVVRISTGHFYYLEVQASRVLSVRYRITTLSSEAVGTISYNSSISVVVHYKDLLSLTGISNMSSLTRMEILNGSFWLFTSEWQDGSKDYRITIQTFNQALEIDRDYVIWIRFSYLDTAPFYLAAEAFVSFRLRERATFIDVSEAPMPAPFLDLVNLTILYRDLELSNGIDNAEIVVSIDALILVEGTDYILQTSEGGIYRISLYSATIGAPGSVANIEVTAQWTMGAPYYSDSSIILTVSVIERSASAIIINTPAQVRYLENITFAFIYQDDSRGDFIMITKSMLRIYSGGVLLQETDFGFSYVDGSYEIIVNSTALSSGLVTNWNVTVFVDWPSAAAPYYTDDSASVAVTVVNRVGIIGIGDPPTSPIGDNMSLTFTFVDERNGIGISDAIVQFDCTSPSGLIENSDYWIFRGYGAEAGQYVIVVDSTSLNGIGQYTFSLRLLWNPSIAPYYRNTTEVFLSGSVRLIHSLLTNGAPNPSTVPINDNVSILLTLTDLDHGLPISGAQSNISVTYKSDGSVPSIWSVTVMGPGLYELVVNCGSITGTDALVIRASLSDYQLAEAQVPIQIRLRQGELSKLPPPDAFFGEQTYVIVELVDLDAFSSPIDGATLIITWPESSSYLYIGGGMYNITLDTISLNAGLYTLVVSAQKANYFIPDISIPIRILSIPTEIILPEVIADVYWGETISVWALFNDTRSGILIPGANVVYQLGVLGGSLSEGVPAGNYTFSVNTGSLPTATTYVISVTATLNNYVTATGQVTVNILRLGLELTIVDGLHDQSLYKGEPVNITVFVRDLFNDVPLTGATVTAEWIVSGQPIYLTQVPGRNGYYTALLDTQEALVKSYAIVVRASKTNYISMSTSASVTIRQIPTVVWLDALTATYSSTSFNWSDTIRIGVYVLSPYENETHPYTTGLSNCVVTWSLSGTHISGEFLNGTLIGGAGYYYFDFRTWEYNATTYSLRITANPNIKAYASSSNMTTLVVNPVETTVESSYVSPKVWGWVGWVNLTYWDLLHSRGVAGATVGIDWEGGESQYQYLIDGIYQVWINTSLVKPGVYPIVVSFWKPNYEGGTGVFTLTVEEVPTELVVYAPAQNQGETELDLRVPFGDTLQIIVFYNDTWSNLGISNATELTAIIMGPAIPDKENLTIMEISQGNYTFIIDSGRWAVSSTAYRIVLSLGLENRSRATLGIRVTIINIPTALIIESDSIVLSYNQRLSVWVYYYDTWPGHDNQGISDSIINATSLNTAYVVVGTSNPDDSRPGWYEITLVSLWGQGSAVVTIELSKSNYESAVVSVAVSVEPSDMDILFERALIYGLPIGVICLVGAILWSRLFSVPKRLREIKGMVKAISKGRIPTVPDGVQTRQQILAGLFNDILEPVKISRSVECMPAYSLVAEVPEIEELLIQLSILTKLKPHELEDFRSDVQKMKLSEQVAFVKEVINQEVIKRSKKERKSIESVREETLEQARAQIAGREVAPVSEPRVPEDEVKPDIRDELKREEEAPSDLLSADEINAIRSKLVDAGIAGHELETIMEQVHELPKDLVDDLLRSILRKGGGKP